MRKTKNLLLLTICTMIMLIVMAGCGKEPRQKIDPEVQTAMEEMQKMQSESDQKPKDPKEEPEVETASEEPDLSGLSMGQQNAIKEAVKYLNYSSFSRQGLIDQLSSEYGSQFSKEDAEYAVAYLEDHEMVDWNEQAVKEARRYLDYSSFSRDGLIDQLTSEYGSQFTQEQAEYAVGQVGY